MDSAVTNRTDSSPALYIERSLGAAILRGEYPVGARLPTVRELARRFEVNAATVQRAVTSLVRLGLVVAQKGSGIVVQDPQEVGDVAAIPLWIEALADQPEAATAMLADFLEVRRILAAQLIARNRAALVEQADVLGDLAGELLAASKGGLDAVRAADAAFQRAVAKAAGNRAALAVVNTGVKLVAAVPEAALALYGDPDGIVRVMGDVVAALRSKTSATRLAADLEQSLWELDRGSLERFERLLHEAERGAVSA